MKNVTLPLYIALALISCPLNSSQIGRNPAAPESWNSTAASSLKPVQEAPACFSQPSVTLNSKTWMQTSGAWKKCQNWGEVGELFVAINALPVGERPGILRLLQTSGAVLRCQTAQEIISLLNTVRGIQTNRILTILFWMQDSRAVLKCPTGSEICSLIDTIAISGASEIQLLKILPHMKNTGVVAKCQDGREISRLFHTIYGLSESNKYLKILNQIKKLGAWEKCQNGEELRGFLCLFGNMERGFSTLKGSVIKTCLVDYGYLSALLKWHRAQGNERAINIFSNWKYIDENDFKNHWDFYIFCHAFYASNNEVKEATRRMIFSAPYPEEILKEITQLLGEKHRFTKWCSMTLGKRRQEERARSVLMASASGTTYLHL